MKKLEIDYSKLDYFCDINDFVLISDEELSQEGMYKNFVYATPNNFVGIPVYPSNMPLIMNKDVWKKIKLVNKELIKHNKCITFYDAFRSIQIQKLFWDYFFETHGKYDETLVANPQKYGTHNIKINAIDIFITNVDGSIPELPCEFDDFSGKANIYYDNCSEEAKNNRDLLISTCIKYGFIVNENEWWYFYDERIKDYGMKKSFINSDLIPLYANEVFILKE